MMGEERVGKGRVRNMMGNEEKVEERKGREG